MLQCLEAGCQNERRKNKTGLSFHKFPNKEKDKQRYDVWVDRCRRKYVTVSFERKKWEPAIGLVVCGLHFE